MNNYRLIGVAFMLFPCLIPSVFGDEADELRQAQEALAESVPALQKLSQAHPDDLEILLGITNLVSGNSHYLSSPGVFPVREQYEKILAADPDNRLANAALARMRTSGYVGQTKLLRSLAGKIDNSKQRGSDRLRLKISSELSEYLKDHTQEIKPTNNGRWFQPYLLIDFDVAQKVLLEKLEAESVPVLEMLDDTESKDPDNAIYDYLRARIYLQLGNTEAVLAAMETGAQKKYLKQYVHQAEQAERRVLDEIDFPQNLRKYISGVRAEFGYFIYRIWKKGSSATAPEKGLSDIATEYEAQGNFDRAENIYRQLIKAGEQCTPEEYSPESGLTKIGQERLDALNARVRPKSDVEVRPKSGAGVLVYAAIAGICLCLLAIALLLRGRAKKRSTK